MAQTFTLCHEEVLDSRKNVLAAPPRDAEPSKRVIENILAFSRTLEVKNSTRLGHVSFLKS